MTSLKVNEVNHSEDVELRQFKISFHAKDPLFTCFDVFHLDHLKRLFTERFQLDYC